VNICLTRTLTGFTAGDEAAAKSMRKIKQGVEVWADISQPRTEQGRRLFRRYWKLCSIVAENVEQYGGASEAASDHILVLAGHYNAVFNIKTGEELRFPKSIAWGNTSEGLFDELWPRCVRAVCEEIMPGVTSTEIENELMQILGASTWG